MTSSAGAAGIAVGVQGLALDDLVAERYSCRAYRADPVPDDIIDEVFALAQRTPSWCNTQPWHVHLFSGEGTVRFGAGLREHVSSGAAVVSDFAVPQVYKGVYRQRRADNGYALYAALGIERSDRAARTAQLLRNFTFFGAPHVAVITTDRDQGVYGAIDCGGYLGTLLLALRSRGIGAVAQGAVAMYADFVRPYLDVPEDRMVVCAVSFGYPDEDHPVNGFRTDRAESSDVVQRRNF